MKLIFKYFAAIALLLLLPASLIAEQTPEEALKVMMTEKSKTFYTILKDKKITTQERQQKILDEVIHLFDFNLMARLALDKTTWKSLTKDQRKAFTDIFVSHIQSSYLSKLDIFADTEVQIKESIRVKKNRIKVIASLKTKTDTKELAYKFYINKKRDWMIYDVEVVGVSFLQSYRAQFSSYLKAHSFDDLIAKLKSDSDDNKEPV